MGLPFETTRRHVNKLVQAGRCVRVRGGVIVPTQVLQHPKTNEATLANVTNVRRFLRALKAAGVTAD
jgi:DeoR/GlpR family transcriptional regulator of sugar metabolism